MQKEMTSSAILSLSLLIASIGFASAQSFGNFLSGIDSSLVILSILFVIFFAVFYFSVSKVFSKDNTVAMVISLCLSALVVYWINNLVDLSGWFVKFGISTGTLYTVGSLLMIALVVFLFIKLRVTSLFIIGGGFILIAIAGLVYNTTMAFLIGIAFIVVGVLLKVSEKPEKRIARKSRKMQEKEARRMGRRH